MQCVLTAFEILSGQGLSCNFAIFNHSNFVVVLFTGSALNIDLRQFYTQLYGAILQLDACKHACARANDRPQP